MTSTRRWRQRRHLLYQARPNAPHGVDENKCKGTSPMVCQSRGDSRSLHLHKWKGTSPTVSQSRGDSRSLHLRDPVHVYSVLCLPCFVDCRSVYACILFCAYRVSLVAIDLRAYSVLCLLFYGENCKSAQVSGEYIILMLPFRLARRSYCLFLMWYQPINVGSYYTWTVGARLTKFPTPLALPRISSGPGRTKQNAFFDTLEND